MPAQHITYLKIVSELSRHELIRALQLLPINKDTFIGDREFSLTIEQDEETGGITLYLN